MKISKIVVSLLVAMAMLLTITSTASAVSDRKIEKEAIKIMFAEFKRGGVEDVSKSSVSVKDLVKNVRHDGVQFAALEIMSNSKEHGPCIIAVYVVFTADGKIANARVHVASMDSKKDVYRSLTKYQSLVKFLGDKTAFAIVSM